MDNKYRMIFFVDGDNLPTTGTNGIRLLDPEDEVHIFYATNNQFFNGAKKEAINQSSRCKVTYTAIPKAPNAVDFAIAMELARRCAISGEDNRNQMYMLVSGDNHFDVIVSELKRCYGRELSVCRVVSVEEGYSRFFMVKVNSLRSFHEILQHQLGMEMGHAVYLDLKRMFAEEAMRTEKRRGMEKGNPAETIAEEAEENEEQGAVELKLIRPSAAEDETPNAAQSAAEDEASGGTGEDAIQPPKKRSRRRRSRGKRKRQTDGETSAGQSNGETDGLQSIVVEDCGCSPSVEEMQHTQTAVTEEDVQESVEAVVISGATESVRSAFGFAQALLVAAGKRR